jgi:hypothetical protein
MKSEKTDPMTNKHGGLIPTMIAVSNDLMERSARAFFATAQDLRGELHQRTLQSLDWLDHAQQGGLRFTRELVNRTESLISAALAGGELLSVRSLALAQRASLGVLETTSQLAAGLADQPSTPSPERQPAQA